ncbi:isovaleryl-CoA dehydrogenase, mitochondrial-like [Portunus trituberculatus]|uniref:isovaleryl-CoA dehydrogenase, mitochondrial-like n=1 Tax=Portunus trituberculatus TaxID=210409 RepID=UPI001E1D0D46|nr:isovaleryl-CoA dehydrogenase, mitochondrial-like [Portunus trituberculatus]
MLVASVRQHIGSVLRATPRVIGAAQVRHHGSHYPIDDTVFGLTEDQQQLRRTIFDFMQKELAPKAAQIDKDNNFPEMRDFWLKMGTMGLLGITASPEYGGSGMSYLDHVIVSEEISRVSAAIALSYGAHSNLCVNQININGTAEQKEKYLPKYTKRRATTASASSLEKDILVGSCLFTIYIHFLPRRQLVDTFQLLCVLFSD